MGVWGTQARVMVSVILGRGLRSTNIALKELVPIVIVAAIWGLQWIGLNVLVLYNYAVVQAINADMQRTRVSMTT